MALPYQEIMKVPGLTGTWKQRLTTFGNRFYGKNYTGTAEQNMSLVSNIQKSVYNPVKAATTKPQSPQQVEPYLAQAQQTAFAEQNKVTTADSPFISESELESPEAMKKRIEGEVKPEGELPAPPQLVDLYEKLR